jgi:hypothetical protein
MYFRNDAIEMKVHSTLSDAGTARVVDAALCCTKNIYGQWHYTVMGVVEDCTLVPLTRAFDSPDEAEKAFRLTLDAMSEARMQKKQARYQKMLKEEDYRRRR